MPEPLLVLGGTRGTGVLIARRLQHQGQRVRLLARDRERPRRLFNPPLEGDSTKPEEAKQLILASCPQHFDLHHRGVTIYPAIPRILTNLH